MESENCQQCALPLPRDQDPEWPKLCPTCLDLAVDRIRIVPKWQHAGRVPPAGFPGPPCKTCGQSTFLELGGGDAPNVNRPNLDVRPGKNVDIVCDLGTESLPFHDGHARYIRAIHVLNHLTQIQGERLVYECHRVLADGGQFVLMVTDVEFVCRRIAEDGLRPIWLTALHGTRGDTHDYDFHKWSYSPETLVALLLRTGFRSIDPWTHYNAWEVHTRATK